MSRIFLFLLVSSRLAPFLLELTFHSAPSSPVVHDPKAPISSGTVHTDRDGNSRTAGEISQQAKEAKAEVDSKKEELKSQGKDAAISGAKQAKSAHDQGGLDEVRNQAQGAAQDAQGAAPDEVSLFLRR